MTMKLHSVTKIIRLCVTFLLFINGTTGAKILSVFGFPGPSQYIMASAFLTTLAERGHEVTSISTFPQMISIKNFHDITVMENSKLFEDLMFKAVNKKEGKSYFSEWREYGKVGCKMVKNVFENSQVQALLKDGKFDLIIVEAFMGEALYGLGQHFNAPMVGVSTFGTINFVDVLVGNISPPSYIPHISLPFNNHMSLTERLLNVVITIMDALHYNYIMLPMQEKLFHKYFPTAKLSFKEAQKNFSLVLINQHFTLSFPRPYVPNMIEVGGLHIKHKPDALSQDMKNLLDNAKEGAIYFSMGSNLKSKDIPKEILNIFLDTFKELELKVLWKFEAESLPDKPGNVFVKSWYPQCSILAHPNVKLFISHGGFLSITETIFYGKPILGIPILGDQPMNVRNAIQNGYALSLELNEITKESFKTTIYELLTNRSYTKRVQELSRYYRDQPQPPLEKAIYWIEYVLRHKGAKHLRNAAMELNYWQFYNIDVYIILISGLIVFIGVLKFTLSFIIKLKSKMRNTGESKVKHN